MLYGYLMVADGRRRDLITEGNFVLRCTIVMLSTFRLKRKR